MKTDTLTPELLHKMDAYWRVAIQTHDPPVALLLTRQDVPALDPSRCPSAAGLKRRAFPTGRGGERPEIILIATGSKLGRVVEASVTWKIRTFRRTSCSPARLGVVQCAGG